MKKDVKKCKKKRKKRKKSEKEGNNVKKCKTEGQRDPHPHQITEVSNLHLSLSTISVSWAQHLFQVHTAKKMRSI